MKGQIFLTISILIIIAIILLRTTTIQKESFSQGNLVEYFKTLKSEIIKTVDLSILNNQNINSNLNDFTSFTSSIFRERGFVQSVNYTVSNVGNTSLVNVSMSLAFEDSYLFDNFIINRTVYS